MATTTYSPSGTDILHLVELDMTTRKQITEPVHLVQYDDRLPILEVHLYKDDAPYSCPSGSEVNVRYEKPDNKVVYNPVLGWNQDRSVIYVQVSIQMTTAYGEANAILEIKTGEKVAGSANFLVVVERNPVQDGAILSTDEVLDLQGFVDDAKSYAEQASVSANTAKSYKDAAASSATQASTSKSSAQTSATQAANSATSASGYANTAKTYRDNAATSATQAEAQKTESTKQAQLSKSYAVGTENVTRPNDQIDNSKAYAEKAKQLMERAQALLEEAERLLNTVSEGGIVPMGPKAFEELPTNPTIGSMYNITNDFTTDDRFAEGSGISYPAGTNIYWTAEGTWDVMVGSVVSGVKGSAEADYHQGFVDISPMSIGLENVENTTDAEKRVAYADEAGSLNNTLQITKGGTGSTTQKGALNNLTSGGRLGEYSVLITNWNNAATSGFYNSNSESQNVPNTKPNKWYGIVNARTNNYIQQILYGFYEEKLHCFGRELIPTVKDPTGSWSGWSELDADASGEIVNPITAGHQLHLANDVMGLKEYCTEITDWNEATKNGWYAGKNAENAPGSDWYFGLTFAQSANYCRQILYSFTTTGDNSNMTFGDRWERFKKNTLGWSDWKNTTPVTKEEAGSIYETATLIADWNDAIKSGWYCANAASNAPESTGWFYGFVIESSPAYVVQKATPLIGNPSASSFNSIQYIRYLHGGTWTRWTKHYQTKAMYPTTGFDSAFRTQINGYSTSIPFHSLIRTQTENVAGLPRYSSGLAWGVDDTNGYLMPNYTNKEAWIGGGAGDKLNWFEKLVLASDIGRFSKLAELTADWNNITESGLYKSVPGNTNAPNTINYFYGIVVVQDNRYQRQIVWQLTDVGDVYNGGDDSNRYERIRTANGWGPWRSTVLKQPIGNVNQNIIPLNKNGAANGIPSQFRTICKGNSAQGEFLSVVRKTTETGSTDGVPMQSSGLAWGANDTGGFLMPLFNEHRAYIGGAYNETLWLEELAFKSQLTSAINEKITKSKTVSQENFIPDAATVFSAITALENRVSILETGEVNNKHYIKLSNGLLICYGMEGLVNVQLTKTGDFVFETGIIELPYTSLTNVISFLTVVTNGGVWITGSTFGNNKSTIGYFLRQTIPTTITTGSIYFLSIGTWK